MFNVESSNLQKIPKLRIYTTQELLDTYGRPVLVNAEYKFWGELNSIAADCRNLPYQLLPNAWEYRSTICPPQDVARIHIYETVDKDTKERTLIIQQDGAWSADQIEKVIKNLGETSSSGQLHNRYGVGLRMSFFALAKDRTLWLIVNRDGEQEEYGIGCVEATPKHVRPPQYLNFVKHSIKESGAIYTCKPNTTSLFLQVDNNSEITAQFLVDEMVYMGDWNICKGDIEIYLYDKLVKSKTQEYESVDVPLLVSKKLIAWRDAYVKGLPTTQREDCIGKYSEPDIKLLPNGKAHWMCVSACGFKIAPEYISNGKSPFEYIINWDFFMNFVNSEKQTAITNKSIKIILDIFYKEVDKEYANNLPKPDITQDVRLQMMTDDICRDVGLISGGTDPNPTRQYRYVCPNTKCVYLIEGGAIYMNKFDLKGTKPTEEERKQLICPHCGTELVAFPETQTEASYCPKCKELGLLTVKYRSVSNKETNTSHHTCLNPDHPHEWDTPSRVASRKGLITEEIHSTKFFSVYENIMYVGVDSRVYSELDLEDKFQLKKTILTPYVEAYANYKKNNEQKDGLDSQLCKAMEMRMLIWEKSHLKDYIGKRKNATGIS